MTMRACVTDTHPLLFHASGGRRLGGRARRHFQACESRRALTYVPAVVMWETCLLARARRVSLGRSTRSFFDDLFSNPAFLPLDLTAEQVWLADEGAPNRDPLDALVCAAARSVELPLLTRDVDIHESDLVTCIW